MAKKRAGPKKAAANPEVVDYLETLDADRKAALTRLRSIIVETVPGAVETMQYKMPFYEYHGILCAFKAQKNYLSFYVMNGEVVDKNRTLLKGFNVGKGCIRLNQWEDLAESTIRRLPRDAAAANEKAFNDHC